MELLLLLIYSSICIFIFKVFRIPLNKWTVPTAILGGIVMLTTMLLVMNYNHPHTKVASQYYVSTPIIPNVRGRVVEVSDIRPDTLVKKGDVLFKVDPAPYQAIVDQRRAALAEIANSTDTLKSDYRAAQASVAESEAAVRQTKREYERYHALRQQDAVSASEADLKYREYKAAQAALEAAKSALDKQKTLLDSDVNGDNAQVAQAKAALVQAEYDLAETVVRAPTDGFVAQNLLKPGMMANTLPLRPVMTFTHHQDRLFVGAFRQNSLQRLKVGDQAEFVFPSIPGKTFQGEVVAVLPSIGESELQANGTLYTGKHFEADGKPLVLFKLTSDISGYKLPYGTSAEIAVYTEHFHHLATMRKILLRMNSWKNYLYLDH